MRGDCNAESTLQVGSGHQGIEYKHTVQRNGCYAHLALRSDGTPSPKKTTSGLRMPPQRGHGGTTKPLPASCSSTSPSGRRTGISTSPSGRRTNARPCARAIPLSTPIHDIESVLYHTSTIQMCGIAHLAQPLMCNIITFLTAHGADALLMQAMAPPCSPLTCMPH